MTTAAEVEETKGASSTPEDSSGSQVQPDTGVKGRPVPYHRFREAQVRGSEAMREIERLQAKVEELESQRGPQNLPDPEEEPFEHLRGRQDHLETQIRDYKKELADLKRDQTYRAETGELDRRLQAAMEANPVLLDPALSDLVEEHFWVSVAADPSVTPEDIAAELADRFKGKSGFTAPEQLADPREKLRGKRLDERTEPLLSQKEKDEIKKLRLRPRQYMDAIFQRNREKQIERMNQEERQLSGL